MKQRAPRWLYILLACYVAVSFLYFASGAVSLVIGYWNLRHQVSRPFNLGNNPPQVWGESAAAKKAGLRGGDYVETLNGVPLRGEAQFQELRWRAHPGDILRVGVANSSGVRKTVAVPLEAQKDRDIPLGETISIAVLQMVLPLICLIPGYWVAFARPRDPNAWLILILLTFPSIFITVSTYNWWPGPWLALRLYWHFLMQPLGMGALFVLGLRFPERSRIDVRVPWLKWVVIAGLGLMIVVSSFTEYAHWYNYSFLPQSARIDAFIDSRYAWLLVFCLIFYFIAIFDKLRTASTPDARRRLRVLCFGSGIGFGVPIVIWGILPRFGIGGAVWNYVGAVFFLAFPYSLAYVVVVQRAMDVGILVRMGTRYLLARWSLIGVQILLGSLLGYHFILPVLRRNKDFNLPVILAMVAIGLILRQSFKRRTPFDRAREWLDRKFFREQYDTEVVLSELATRVRRVADPAALVDLISTRISEILHVSKMAVLLRQGNTFQLQTGGALALGHLSTPVQHLERTSSPAVLYRDKPADWFLNAAQKERVALDELNAEVLLPLPGRDKLMGVMVLGPKLSEEPYSPTDLRLLQWVAVQAGMGLEVNELAQSLAEEASRHQRIQREVEIAREVQERLFPQTIPSIPGVELAGHCRPALGVGGDYYDMILLDDGRLALAIGDVSGKGIAAALLMASLRASLRGMTADGVGDLGRMMRKLNRLVYEASAVNRYATFFFAVFDPATRQLRFVNGGHNPPMVVRGSEVLSLEAGGPVIGLLKDVEFEEQSVQLQPGDVFLGYTDGISEAMTIEDEEWGEERMLAATKTTLPVDDMLKQVFEAADEFTAGAPQHDDMTLLVMKLS